MTDLLPDGPFFIVRPLNDAHLNIHALPKRGLVWIVDDDGDYEEGYEREALDALIFALQQARELTWGKN